MKFTDPILIGDISGNGRINALDAVLAARIAAGLDVKQESVAVGILDTARALSSERPKVPLTANAGELPELFGRDTAVADWYRAAVDQILSGEPVLSSDGRDAQDMLLLDRRLDEILSSTDEDELRRRAPQFHGVSNRIGPAPALTRTTAVGATYFEGKT
jgi:hypothetical protein